MLVVVELRVTVLLTVIVIKKALFTSVLPAIQQLKKVYLRLTESEFKTRCYKYSESFRTKSYPNSTTLSSYVWEVKTEQNETSNLNWEIVRSVPAYSNITK